MSENKTKLHLVTAIRTVVLIFAVIVAYSVVLVTIGYGILPFQSTGSIVTLDNGDRVGSTLIGQEFQSPKFFHTRPASETASGVDPHITPDDAFSQVESVSQSTGIPENHLRTLIQLNIERNRTLNLSAFAPES
jgi:K+-transporting ATPase ATPase C chain